MEPRINEGDLVVLKTGSYGIGDVVGYQSKALQRVVMHRIVEDSPEGYVTQGDNNDWLDTDRPTDADVIGKEWLHVPGAGKWLVKARSPGVAALLLGLLTLTFFLGNEKKKRRARTGKGPEVPRIALDSLTSSQKTMLAGCGVAALIFFLLAAISFRQPLVSPISADAAYEHVGDFDYSAQVEPNPVYPGGKVEPGRPVFLRLVDQLDVSFTYQLSSKAPHKVSGQAMMFARIRGATGWTKAIPISRIRAFEGDQVKLDGTLDFDKIQSVSKTVQDITGLTESEQVVELVPRIDVQGQVAGESISEQFTPTLAFQMDTYQFRVAAGTPEAAAAGGAPALSDPLHQTEPGEVSVSDIRSNSLNLLGASVGIRSARTVSLLGLLAAAIAAAVLWLRFSRPAHRDESALIAAQYGEWLIPIESSQAQSQQKIVRVKSIEALVRLAELYERMILHQEGETSHTYLVEEEGVVYCYQTADATEGRVTERKPASRPHFGSRRSREEQRKVEVARLREELSEIEAEVLQQNKAGRPEDQ